jgi:hypothetical protein
VPASAWHSFLAPPVVGGCDSSLASLVKQRNATHQKYVRTSKKNTGGRGRGDCWKRERTAAGQRTWLIRARELASTNLSVSAQPVWRRAEESAPPTEQWASVTDTTHWGSKHLLMQEKYVGLSTHDGEHQHCVSRRRWVAWASACTGMTCRKRARRPIGPVPATHNGCRRSEKTG